MANHVFKIFIGTLILISCQNSIGQSIELKQVLEGDYILNNYALDFYFNENQLALHAQGNAFNPNDSLFLYNYQQVSDKWTLDTKITPKVVVASRRFGIGISVEEDNMVVGAFNANQYVSPNYQKQEVGEVIYLEKDTGGWKEIQHIYPSDGKTGDHFSRNLIRNEDELFVSSGNSFDENGLDSIRYSGAVYYYKFEGGQWVEKQKIVPPDRKDEGDWFGITIGHSADQLFVGSRNGLDSNGLNDVQSSGSLYVLEKNLTGKWEVIQKLKASDSDENDAFSALFGGYWSGGITAFGESLIVGSLSKTDEKGKDSIDYAGAVYYFKKNQNGTWSEKQKIVSPQRHSAFFGQSISVNDSILVVGAPEDQWDENGTDSVERAGAFYIYFLTSAGEWEFWKKVVSTNRDARMKFASKTVLIGDRLMVNDNRNGSGPGIYSGAIHYYRLTKGQSIPDGVNGLGEIETVEIYPNPTNEKLNIRSKFQIKSFQIINIQGQISYESTVYMSQNRTMSIDVNQLPPGMYLMRIQGVRDTYYRRFIKQ